MAADSIGRSASRRADRQKLPFKHATGITKAHANRGFGVKLSALADQFGMATVDLVDTAGDSLTGELLDVHDDGTCSVEVRDMILRTNNAPAAADLGDPLAGRGTVDGQTDVTTSTTLMNAPIVYGGFSADDGGTNTHFFRAMRY